MPGDDPVTQHLLVGEPEVGGAMSHESIEFDKTALVEQEVEPLSGGEFSLFVLLGHSGGTAALFRLGLAMMEVVEQLALIRHGGGNYTPDVRARKVPTDNGLASFPG